MRPVHDGLFERARDGTITLIGGFSPTSGRYHFPLEETCPFSGTADVERVALARTGTLWAWTAVTAAPPGYLGDVPFGFGVVELPEGIRVITRLTEADPERLSFGMSVEVVATPLDAEVITYAFAPVGSQP
jgi:uncharacterized OB-fold protein